MTGNAAVKQAASQSGIDALLSLSGRLGRDPLLVQASSGNTSLKLDGTLWVKASGKWLADAEREEIFVPLELAECLRCFRRADPLPTLDRSACAPHLRPSIETFMHAVLPQRFVVHVHSVNTIAWAVRSDAPLQLAIRLFGLNWSWIPYVGSGLPLAREVHLRSDRKPHCDIFVLGNHGLVICGDDCSRVESLLYEVERRLATAPRIVPQANLNALEKIQQIPGWRLPADKTIHALGTDGISRRVVDGGVLYPCQAIFLGGILPILERGRPFARLKKQIAARGRRSPSLIVERSGVLMRENITAAEVAALRGYVDVVRRIGPSAPIRYLTSPEIKSVVQAPAHHLQTVL
jgi:rhamnose utilization protein RhaD (predicted bifunctional aldolase and dehydrogenase)